VVHLILLRTKWQLLQKLKLKKLQKQRCLTWMQLLLNQLWVWLKVLAEVWV
jgi:hypothetical protein